MEHPLILKIARAVKVAGGRALLVGGLVRDRIMEREDGRDFDVEVYGIDGTGLRKILEKLGPVKTVGEAFAVYKIGDVDVSIPRRDSKTGPGHKGFTVVGDPTMTVEEAARRRDFTINAILSDPLSGEVIDPFHGADDIRARRLRAVDPATFVEDSLRVLRAMQFAARFEFTIDPATIALCRTISLKDLPAERIWGEFEKLLLRAKRPSIGLAAALDLGIVDQLFPELKALVGCPQEPQWHPEGDVWVHTLQAVDVAAGMISDLPKGRQLAVMLGVLCHDLGKPATTKMIDGRVRSLDHEDQGVPPTERVLETLNVHTVDGYDVRREVKALVADHLKPSHFYMEKGRICEPAFPRPAPKVQLQLLYRVSKPDSLGRRAPGAPEPQCVAHGWFIDRVRTLGVEKGGPKPLLMGRT